MNEYPREVLLEWGPSSPWQDALQFSPGYLNNEDNFHAFILGAGLLHGIIEWSQTLQWPVAQHADDPGISQFELVSHFVHCFGMALPEVASRAKGYPIYADKVRDKEYDCLPATGAGAVRFLPSLQCVTLSQLWGFKFFQWDTSLGVLFWGLLVLVLWSVDIWCVRSCQRFYTTCNVFPSLISTTGLMFPEPCGQVRMGSQRRVFSSDTWDHGKRGAILEQFFNECGTWSDNETKKVAEWIRLVSTLLVWMYRMGFSIPFGMLFSLLVVCGLHMLAQILCRSRLDNQVGEIL